MKLRDITEGLEILECSADAQTEIRSVTCDSRKVESGAMFIAIKGFSTDGHNFIAKAVEDGAAVILCSDAIPEGVKAVRVRDSRAAMAIVADNFYGHPSRKLSLVGVTGTNGKTTIATLLFRLHRSMGYACGLLSTIANWIEDERFETVNTTQDAITINALLARMVDKGCAFCFMEVSSIALHQDRTAGLHFKGAIFTNLTHDHLDYHKTFAEYLRCKKLFFDRLPKGSWALTNLDDKNGEVMLQNTKADKHNYSICRMADFNAKIIEKSIEGMLLSINGTQVWTRFIGEHNASNIAAVYGAATLLKACTGEELLEKISALSSVNGRLEYIKGPNDVTAVVDYAHTPDALENVLKTLLDVAKGKEVTAVFGCGGDRDRTKRPEMAAIGAKYAQRVVLTSDNPRSEDPDAILEEMRSGLVSAADKIKTTSITDRREAIRNALTTAPKGAIVLIAGKGHEDYQIVKGVKSHFDDKEVVRDTFELMQSL